MSDRRELILARLLDVMQEAGNATGEVSITCKRNYVTISETDVPIAVLFDGDEEAEPLRENHSPKAASKVTMIPEIFIWLQDKSDNVGTDVNSFRTKFISAICNDSELRTIAGPNGSIRYRGMGSEMHAVTAVMAKCTLRFAITYPLFVHELT